MADHLGDGRMVDSSEQLACIKSDKIIQS